MKEKLPSHEVEGSVVEEPTNKKEAADRVILDDTGFRIKSTFRGQSYTSLTVLTAFKVSEATLISQHEHSPYGNVGDNCQGAQPPNGRISNQIDLTVFLDPEILQSKRS